ncbi:MAG: OB-fold domain-containing protein [Sporichthyaceae bacterium]
MGLLVDAHEPQTMAATLTMPYTLTTGPAAGTFLAELGQRRIIATRVITDGRVIVPPADYPGGMVDVATEFVVLRGTGVVTAWTRTADGVLAFIRLDGADTDLAHRIVGASTGLRNGSRVHAVWSDAPAESLSSPFLALDGFALSEEEPDGPAVSPYEPAAEPFAEMKYGLKLDYEHSYGPYYGRMFDELASARRIVGSKCPKCLNILVPARGNCDSCFVPTGQMVDVADTGTILGFSVIHLEFVGQKLTPPYVYAEINLDGTATRLIHNVAGIDMAQAEELLQIGSRVRAVWKTSPLGEGSPGTGTLDDIEYFEPY